MDSLMLTGETSGESLNFFVRLSTMLNKTKTVIWVVKHNNEEHFLLLRHNRLNGKRTLLMDGKFVFDCYKWPDRSQNIGFHIGTMEGYTGIIFHHEHFKQMIIYTLVFNGTVIPSVLATNYNYTLSKTVVIVNKLQKRDKVMLYEVQVQQTVTSPARILIRRYNDFLLLHAQLQSFYKETPYYVDYPPFPSPKKVSKRNEEKFIEERRQQLQAYLSKVIQLPYSRNNPDLLMFLEFPIAPCFSEKDILPESQSGTKSQSNSFSVVQNESSPTINYISNNNTNFHFYRKNEAEDAVMNEWKQKVVTDDDFF